MKKMIALLLALILCISFVACSEEETEPTETKETTFTTNPTTDATTTPTVGENTETETPVMQKPIASVSLPEQTNAYTADDGTVILNHSYQYMMMTLSDAEVADKIIIDFMNRVDAKNAAVNSILASAKAAYTPSANWMPYQYAVSYTPERVDSGVLSLLGCDATYHGAHVETVFHSVNYSMVTGNPLSLYNIILDKKFSDQLCEATIADLSKREAELSLFPDYEATVRQYFTGGANDAWYFNAEGLCFFFSPYEIAPYSSGVVTAQIPYENLGGILKEEYFPEERDPVAGKILMLDFNTDNQQMFSQFSELILDEGAHKFLLYTDKAAYDIQIDIGNRSASGTFRPKQTVFASASLTPGDAITVEADLSDNACLRVRYLSGNDYVTALIFLDSETNTPTISA